MNLLRKLFSVPSETLQKIDFTIPMEETEASHHDENNGEEEEEEVMMRIWDCGSPLYDSYELASLSHVIERHFMMLPSLGGSTHEVGQINQIFSSAESNDVMTLPPPGSSSSSSSSSPPPLNDDARKKLGGGSSSMVAYFTDFLERSISRKKKMEGESKEKAKKTKGDISRIFLRTNLRKK